jgi:cell division protein FtsB
MSIRIRIAEGWIYRMRRVLATVCLAALATFLGYKVMVGANGIKVWQSKRAEVRQLQGDIERMQREQQELQRRVEGLQRGDPASIEKEAREQLGYVKPGEVVLFEQKTSRDPKPPALAENIDQK